MGSMGSQRVGHNLATEQQPELVKTKGVHKLWLNCGPISKIYVLTLRALYENTVIVSIA